jgi:hypothetical protein
VTLLPVLRGFLAVPELLLGDAGDDPAVAFRPVMMPREPRNAGISARSSSR